MDDHQLCLEHHRHDLELHPSIVEPEPHPSSVELDRGGHVGRRKSVDDVQGLGATDLVLA